MRTRTNIAKANRAKGHRAQKLVAKKLLEYFPDLHPLDIQERQGSCNGTDIMLTVQALEKIPWAIEVKTRKKIELINYIKTLRPCESIGITDTDLRIMNFIDFIAIYKNNYLHKITSVPQLDQRYYPPTAFLMESFKQAIANMDSHYKKPVLILKQDRDPTLVVVYNYYDFV